jgi:hypothetical protein
MIVCCKSELTALSLFPKAYIDTALENDPSDAKLFLQVLIKASAPEPPYFLSHLKMQALLAYEMKFNDAFCNAAQHLIECPEILLDFFQKSNNIDKHNQLRQGNLALEKRWLTQNPYFRLHTTIIGMFIVICFPLSFHLL